jgi:hypothetical protein
VLGRLLAVVRYELQDQRPTSIVFLCSAGDLAPTLPFGPTEGCIGPLK